MIRIRIEQILPAIPIIIAILLCFGASETFGFVVRPHPSSNTHHAGHHRIPQRDSLLPIDSRLFVYPSEVIDSSSLTLAAESWRQYVPLVVSVGIIIDILLGNPLANAVLKPMRPEEETGQEGEETKNKSKRPRSKARIDAELVAKQALDKANNTLELRNFLEERKTDFDRMEEMKRKLDASMQDLDENLEARQKTIDERKTD